VLFQRFHAEERTEVEAAKHVVEETVHLSVQAEDGMRLLITPAADFATPIIPWD